MSKKLLKSFCISIITFILLYIFACFVVADIFNAFAKATNDGDIIVGIFLRAVWFLISIGSGYIYYNKENLF
jgi:uncharacterized membrane protein